MDIVYLLKESNENEELIYSLRSLRNLPHDKVFVVGGFPHGLNPEKVYHIPTDQSGNRYKNTTLSLYKASKCDEISEDFILMNDDFFVMSRIEDPVKELNLYEGFLDDKIESLKKRQYLNESYINSLSDTYNLLLHIGLYDPFSYELHIPMVMNRKNLLEIFYLPNFLFNPAVNFRSIYGNMFLEGSKYTSDVKLSANTPMMPDNPNFLSTSDGYFAKIKPFIKNIFDEKSEYEL